MKNSNNSITTTSFDTSCLNHYHQRQMRIMISPPPLPLSPNNRQMVYVNAPHSPVLSIESSSGAGRSMPMRKQSVFVAPSDLSIRTQPINSFSTPSKEEISQRITKLIQENSAIVDNPIISNNSSTTAGSNSNYHHRSLFSASNTHSQSHCLENNYDELQPTYPITMSTKLCQPLRRHSSSTDNPPVQPQQSFVIIHPDDLNSDLNLDASTSTNFSISKLQSALLGANITELRHYNRPHYSSNFSYSTLPYNHNLNQRSFITGNSIESLNSLHPNLVISQHQIIRKYSENILSSRSQYANIASAIHTNNTPLVLGSNSHRSISSESCLFPSLYTQQHSVSSQHQSVIISREKDLITNPPFYFSSSSESSDPKSCLVRNLLLSGSTSTTSSYLITSSSALNHSYERLSTTTANNPFDSMGNNTLDVSTTDQNCIIKDLLLKSSKKSLPVVENSNNSQQAKSIISNNESPSSPSTSRKRSRLSTSSNCSDVQIMNHLENQNGQQQKSQINQQVSNQQIYTCRLCLVQFRNEQNLEIHRKYYCCGQHPSQQQSVPVTSAFGHLHRSIPKPQIENKTINLARERKVSVLERPSIITYNANSCKNHLNNSITTTTIGLANNYSKLEIEEERKNNIKFNKTSPQYNFGNILKTKLLSGSYDAESELLNYENFQSDYLNNWPTALLKKRKISEPAYRFQYLSNNGRIFH